MFKTRLRLGPRLIAQTHRNPHLQVHRYTYLKVAAVLLFLASGFLLVKRFLPYGSVATTGSLPKKEAVLGAQKEDIQPAPYYQYTAQTPDSLFSISEKFQISWETIVSLNGLKEPFALTPGQQLKLPLNPKTKEQQFSDNLKKKIYIVQSGDSFVSIAQKLNLSVNELLHANPQLTAPDTLKPDQTLKLP